MLPVATLLKVFMGLTLVHFQKYWLLKVICNILTSTKNEDSKKDSNTGCEGRAPKQNPRGKAKKTAMMMPALLPLPTLAFIHSLYIRSASSQHLLSTLLIQFKLVYGMFEQSNMHSRSDTMKPKLFGIQIWWYQTFLLT